MNNNKEDTRENLTRQELYCHECGNYVQFTIDQNLDGNHVLECPKCKHEHCRVVKDGVITGDRWDSRNKDNGLTWTCTNATYSVASTYTTYSDSTSTSLGVTINYSDSTNATSDATTGDVFLYQNWINTT